MALERLFLKPEAFYAENDIDLRTDSHVTKVDAASKSVEIGEDVLSYDALEYPPGTSKISKFLTLDVEQEKLQKQRTTFKTYAEV